MFRPAGVLTRYEMSVVLQRVFQLKENENSASLHYFHFLLTEILFVVLLTFHIELILQLDGTYHF
jgi:hypothetical protein